MTLAEVMSAVTSGADVDPIILRDAFLEVAEEKKKAEAALVEATKNPNTARATAMRAEALTVLHQAAKSEDLSREHYDRAEFLNRKARRLDGRFGYEPSFESSQKATDERSKETGEKVTEPAEKVTEPAEKVTEPAEKVKGKGSKGKTMLTIGENPLPVNIVA